MKGRPSKPLRSAQSPGADRRSPGCRPPGGPRPGLSRPAWRRCVGPVTRWPVPQATRPLRSVPVHRLPRVRRRPRSAGPLGTCPMRRHLAFKLQRLLWPFYKPLSNPLRNLPCIMTHSPDSLAFDLGPGRGGRSKRVI